MRRGGSAAGRVQRGLQVKDAHRVATTPVSQRIDIQRILNFMSVTPSVHSPFFNFTPRTSFLILSLIHSHSHSLTYSLIYALTLCLFPSLAFFLLPFLSQHSPSLSLLCIPRHYLEHRPEVAGAVEARLVPGDAREIGRAKVRWATHEENGRNHSVRRARRTRARDTEEATVPGEHVGIRRRESGLRAGLSLSPVSASSKHSCLQARSPPPPPPRYRQPSAPPPTPKHRLPVAGAGAHPWRRWRRWRRPSKEQELRRPRRPLGQEGQGRQEREAVQGEGRRLTRRHLVLTSVASSEL